MEDFINQLLQAKGLPADLEEDVRKQLVEDMMGRAADLINRRLLEAMSDDSVDAFNELLERDDTTQEMVQAFIAEHVPDKEAVTRHALEEFRDLYLGSDGQTSQADNN